MFLNGWVRLSWYVGVYGYIKQLYQKYDYTITAEFNGLRENSLKLNLSQLFRFRFHVNNIASNLKPYTKIYPLPLYTVCSFQWLRS